jgi:hypothetical protein
LNTNSTWLGRVLTSLVGALVVAGIGFFVWLANVAVRISVLEQLTTIQSEANKRIEETNQTAINRIEHEREANDARVRDDLRELRAKVFH